VGSDLFLKKEIILNLNERMEGTEEEKSERSKLKGRKEELKKFFFWSRQ
jgi:hypothetical protein